MERCLPRHMRGPWPKLRLASVRSLLASPWSSSQRCGAKLVAFANRLSLRPIPNRFAWQCDYIRHNSAILSTRYVNVSTKSLSPIHIANADWFGRTIENWTCRLLSRVDLCRVGRYVQCTHPSAVVNQFPILQSTRLDKFSTCSVFIFFNQIVVNSVANSIHTARRDATRQLSRLGVGGIFWALVCGPMRLSETAVK